MSDLIQRLRESATRVVEHQDHVNERVWRRLFHVPREPHLVDRTREFIQALDSLLDVPPTQIAVSDMKAVSAEVERVVSRLETRISALSDPGDKRPFTEAVYVIRTRFEDLYRRGALGG